MDSSKIDEKVAFRVRSIRIKLPNTMITIAFLEPEKRLERPKIKAGSRNTNLRNVIP
jgi:hypothetical protein